MATAALDLSFLEPTAPRLLPGVADDLEAAGVGPSGAPVAASFPMPAVDDVRGGRWEGMRGAWGPGVGRMCTA